MPVAPGGAPPARQALIVGFAAVIGLLAIVFVVTQMDRLVGSVGTVDISLGDGIFRPGSAQDVATAIDEDGPILLSDPSGGDRDIVLQHLGDDPDEGWLALAARQPTAARDCFVQWMAESRTFVDNCEGTVYPEDGAGLPEYPVTVDEDGNLEVDLNVVISPTNGR